MESRGREENSTSGSQPYLSPGPVKAPPSSHAPPAGVPSPLAVGGSGDLYGDLFGLGADEGGALLFPEAQHGVPEDFARPRSLSPTVDLEQNLYANQLLNADYVPHGAEQLLQSAAHYNADALLRTAGVGGGHGMLTHGGAHVLGMPTGSHGSPGQLMAGHPAGSQKLQKGAHDEAVLRSHAEAGTSGNKEMLQAEYSRGMGGFSPGGPFGPMVPDVPGALPHKMSTGHHELFSQGHGGYALASRGDDGGGAAGTMLSPSPQAPPDIYPYLRASLAGLKCVVSMLDTPTRKMMADSLLRLATTKANGGGKEGAKGGKKRKPEHTMIDRAVCQMLYSSGTQAGQTN